MKNDDDNYATCPEGVMDYITDMLGTAFRDKMIATLGGTEIKVPCKNRNFLLSDEHWLVKALGRIDAEELVDTAPGAALYVPIGPKPNKPNKTSELVTAMVRNGLNDSEIARSLNICVRQVRRHRARSGLSATTLASLYNTPLRYLTEAIKANPHLLPAPQ